MTYYAYNYLVHFLSRHNRIWLKDNNLICPSCDWEGKTKTCYVCKRKMIAKDKFFATMIEEFKDLCTWWAGTPTKGRQHFIKCLKKWEITPIDIGFSYVEHGKP